MSKLTPHESTMPDSVIAHENPSVTTAGRHASAPLWENIQQFRQQLRAPFYCPGHKGGRTLPPELTADWASCDLNNLPDTDTLHCPHRFDARS